MYTYISLSTVHHDDISEGFRPCVSIFVPFLTTKNTVEIKMLNQETTIHNHVNPDVTQCINV